MKEGLPASTKLRIFDTVQKVTWLFLPGAFTAFVFQKEVIGLIILAFGIFLLPSIAFLQCEEQLRIENEQFKHVQTDLTLANNRLAGQIQEKERIQRERDEEKKKVTSLKFRLQQDTSLNYVIMMSILNSEQREAVKEMQANIKQKENQNENN